MIIKKKNVLVLMLFFALCIPGLRAEDKDIINPVTKDSDFFQFGPTYNFLRLNKTNYHELGGTVEFRHLSENGFTFGGGFYAGSAYCAAVFGFIANLFSLFEITEEEDEAGEQILPFDISDLNPSTSATFSVYAGYAFFEHIYLLGGLNITYACLPEAERIHNLMSGAFVRFNLLVFSLSIGCDFLQFRKDGISVEPSFRISGGINIPKRLK